VETVWDLASLAAGVHSISNWDETTSFVQKALDVVGVGVDAIAAAIPVIPGGASALLAAGNGARAAQAFGKAKAFTANVRNKTAQSASRALQAAKGTVNASVQRATSALRGVLRGGKAARGVSAVVNDVFSGGATHGRDLFRRARDVLANNRSLNAAEKADAFEQIAGQINHLDPSWMANRGAATNAAGFFTGDARPFGFAIDHQGQVWQTQNIVDSVSFGGHGATLDFAKWTRVE
jgi:hypothetical protein